MINPINTASHPAKNTKQRIIKYTTAGIIGAAAGAGFAFIPRTYYPQYVKKTKHKLALTQYMKNPYKYIFSGALILLSVVALADFIKAPKRNSQ